MQGLLGRLQGKSDPKRSSRRGMLPCLQLAIAAAFIVGVAAVALTLVKHSRNDAAEELVGRGSTVTSIIARLAGRAAANAEDEADAELALDRIIYDVRAEEGLEYAFIADQSGRAVAHSDAGKKGRVLPQGLPNGDRSLAEAKTVEHSPNLRYTVYSSGGSEYAFDATRTVYEFVRTVPLSAKARERYGALDLHVGFSLPGFWPFAQSSLKRAAPALAVAFVLLIAGNFLAGVFIRPLRKLRSRTAKAAEAVEGDEDWQLDVRASGEIAEIAENWNRMVENFRSSYQQVLDARRDLEVRNRVMRYEKRRTEAIIDSLSDGVIVTDGYGKVSFINREATALLGVEHDTAMGRAPDEVIAVEPVQAFLAEVLGPLRAGAGHSSLGVARARPQRRAQDVQIERPNGTRHVHILHVPVLEGNGGKLIGAVTTFRDVTQAKLEEQARKEFVSSVTHELRTPLTTIKSYVEMLIDDEARDPELQREFFNTINEEADRLARLINDMLNMSKMEVGNLVLNKSLVRTRKLIEDAVNGVRSSARGKQIELTANVSETLPDVEADKDLVRVVVTNLLSNGIKYTPEGGKVFLSAELVRDPSSPAQQGYIAVSVADNGPGVPADERDKIFEKFYRGKQTAGSSVAGNGLGLALSRQIASLHGGDIKLDSTEGAGSKFTFLLPAVETSRKVS
jgi:PAS domain S-box-containing protein